MGKINCSLRFAFEQFLTEKTLICTPSTLAGYRSSTRQFIDYADVPMVSENVRWAVIEYLSQRRGTVSDYSLHTYWRILRVFCRWLTSEGLIDTIKLPVVKAPQRVIRPYSLDEVRQVVDSPTQDLFGCKERRYGPSGVRYRNTDW